jgi:SAM-dependent MidA family methyltransferase
MRDMLDIINRFPECNKAVTVHMVELSEFMRGVQVQELCGVSAGTDLFMK